MTIEGESEASSNSATSYCIGLSDVEIAAGRIAGLASRTPVLTSFFKRSREAGELLGHHEDNQLNSVADGLKTTLGPNTWPIVRDLVDDIITVSEEGILRATKLIWERLKVCIEPSAGVGVAVAMSDEFASKYRMEDGIVNVGVILCGGNVDIIQTCKLMEQMGL